MQTLKHEHIVQYEGCFVRADQLHICMEYMDGKPAGLSADSVANMLKKYGPFQEEHIARYTFQVLKGLHYLHSKHIIHRCCFSAIAGCIVVCRAVCGCPRVSYPYLRVH